MDDNTVVGIIGDPSPKTLDQLIVEAMKADDSASGFALATTMAQAEEGRAVTNAMNAWNAVAKRLIEYKNVGTPGFAGSDLAKMLRED
jgi:hypothetical protein